MKLLLLSEFFPASEKGNISGGVEARNFYLAKYFAGELTVFTSQNDNSKEETKIFNAKVKRLGYSYKYSQNASLIKRFLFAISCVYASSSEFDIVEGTNFITHFTALIIGKIRKIKVVLWYPDVWVGEWVKNLGLKGIFGEILERIVLFFGHNAKFIAISASTKEKLIKNGIPEKNIFIIPCGVDENEIEKIKKVIVTKKYDIVAVNRLVKYKQTEMVIKAALDKNLSLLIIGDGPEKENLNKLIIASDGRDKIKIISGIKSHTDLLRAMSEARIYISASRVEGFGITAIEAASLGLPCLLFNNSAFAEIAKNLQGVMIFKSIEELKFDLDKIINNSSIYDELRQKNVQTIKLYFWKTIVKKTVEFYKKVA